METLYTKLGTQEVAVALRTKCLRWYGHVARASSWTNSITSIAIPSVSARPEFLGVIDDPLFENLGVIGKFRESELFQCIITFCLSMRQY